MMQATLFLNLPKNVQTLNCDFPESGQNTLFGEKAVAPKIDFCDDLKLSLDALKPECNKSELREASAQKEPKNDFFNVDDFLRNDDYGSDSVDSDPKDAPLPSKRESK